MLDADAAVSTSSTNQPTPSGPTVPGPTGRRLYWSVAGVLIGLAAVLRVRQWLFGRGMWGDELFIAHNIQARNFKLMLLPLDYSQSAPVGWLWLQRIVLLVFGGGEQALRLVPLLFGLALTPLVAYFGWRLMSRPAAWAAVALVAFAPELIGFSNQVKQYSSEAFWVTLVVGLAMLLTRERLTRRAGIVFWVVATAAVMMSTLAIPVSGALGGLLVLRALADRTQTWSQRWRTVGRFMTASPVWLVVALGMGVLLLRATRADVALREYWHNRGVYPARPLTDLPATWTWLTDKVMELSANPWDMWSPTLFLLTLLVGAVLCWRRAGGLSVVMPILPIAIGLAAGAVSAYPLIDRLALYAVPAILILTGFAASSPLPARSVLGWARCALGLAAIAVLLAPQLGNGLDGLRHPQTAYKIGGGGNLADYRGALRYIQDHKLPGDAFFVTRESSNAQSYYGPPADGIILPAEAGGCTGSSVATQLAGRTRVWMFQATDYTDVENQVLNERLGRGAAISEYLFVGGRVVLIELLNGDSSGTDVCVW